MSAESLMLNMPDNEDSEDDSTFQPRAFVVPDVDEDEDLSAPPMDGYGFLKRVVQESKRCSAVVVKKVKTKPQKNVVNQILDFPEEKCNPDFYMNKKTQVHCLAEFSELRLRYEARRNKMQEAVINRIRIYLPSAAKEEEWLKLLSQTPPNLTKNLSLYNPSVEVCLAIPHPIICRVMEYMGDWITNGKLSIPVACQWIYTLLACVGLPLDPDMSATLRQIARVLLVHRSKLENITCDELPHINIVICVIARYFSQLDLADPLV